MKQLNKLFPVSLVFVLVNVIVFSLNGMLTRNSFDTKFILIANALLFALISLSILMQLRTLRSANNHAFIRGVYTSMLIKMTICLIAIFIYIFSVSDKVNKPGLFTAMGLYILYTAVEVSGLMKAARKKNA